jgi:polar amino acid transport system substrate-binding protein
MKKFGIFISILLAVVLLYNRTFFLQDSTSGYKKTTWGLEKTVPVANLNPAAAVRPRSYAKPHSPSALPTLIFPPKSKPLVMPTYTWPPFNLRDKTGIWRGADIDIVEAVLGRMGYQVKWVDMPFARALEEMKTSKFPAMAPCVIGGGREKYIFFSAPVSSIYSVLWKKKSDNFSWQTYDDLKGRVIGASYYNYGAGFLKAGKSGKFKLDMVAAKAPEVIHFRKLLRGETDMFISELSVGLYLRAEHAPEFDQVDYVPTGVGPTRPFCFAISRKYFAGREAEMHRFVNAFNQELATFAGEGERKKIFDKYHMLIKVDDHGMVIIPGHI